MKYLQINYIILFTSIILLIFIITKFQILIAESKFSFPNFEYKKEKFEKKFEEATYLNKYKELLIWDSFFAIVYSGVFFSIINISNYYVSYPIYNLRYYTIPIHILLDWMENLIGYLIISNYDKNSVVDLNVPYFLVSSCKWLVAAFNIGMILLSLFLLILQKFN